MDKLTYHRYIKEQVIMLNKDVIVNKRAIQLQIELSDEDLKIPYEDAYEMAYNEIILGDTI
jgi:hypothetical protein